VRGERVGGYLWARWLGQGARVSGEGIELDGGGRIRARAKLEEGDDRRALPVSVSRWARTYRFGRGGLAGWAGFLAWAE
jgi:hypothetical protein